MYVCICNAIRDCELREAARSTAGDIETIYQAIGKRPNCRQCLDDAHDIMVDERRKSLAILAAA